MKSVAAAEADEGRGRVAEEVGGRAMAEERRINGDGGRGKGGRRRRKGRDDSDGRRGRDGGNRGRVRGSGG